MNVLITALLDEECGGVASVVGNLAQQLTKGGHRVLFLYNGDYEKPKAKVTKWNFLGYELRLRIPFEPPDEAHSNYRSSLKRVAGFVCYYPWTLFQLYRFLSEHKIDIVNIHYPSEYYAYFAVLRKMRAFRLVLSIHGADLFPNGQRRVHYSRSFASLIRAADLLVSPSRNMLDEALSIFPSLKDKTICIHNGVNLKEFESRDSRLEESGQDYILCVAMHNYRKAIDILIKAFATISESHVNLELWLAGDGPLRGELERLASHYVPSGRIKFLGLRSREEVKVLLRQCKLFVLPSRAEPFGIAILEALASSKPVVATSVGGIPEIIQNEITGMLVEPDNPGALTKSIRTVLSDKALMDNIIRRGYASVKEHFQWERAGAMYERAFRDLLVSKEDTHTRLAMASNRQYAPKSEEAP